MATTYQRKTYTGTEKALVIGIDIGTTLSGVSYTLLEPGKVPQIQPVTRFSGQTEAKGNSKVPSVVCYDRDGGVLAVGPETDPEINPRLSEEDGVRRAEWFKLRLRPPLLAADKKSQLEKIWSPPNPADDIDNYTAFFDDNEDDNEIILDIEGFGEEVPEPEPLKKIIRPVTDDFKTVVQVFADFLKYLFQSAKEYIIETQKHLNPSFAWSSIERNTYFVLTHPNGWEGKQQSQMRDAAVAAGLVDRSKAADRITFLTEGEADLHFCLNSNPRLYKESGGLLVVDCGGGTIDLSAYSKTGNGSYKETVSPDCLLQGSIFITSRARDYFKGRFKGSQFGSDDSIEAMARAFDKPEGAKCMFRNANTPYFIKFGGLNDKDRKYGISAGNFKLEGAQVAKFFEPAVQDIVDGIERQCKNAKGASIKYILLVGGFGRSEYLYAKLRNHFEGNGIIVLRPDSALLNKAVADGAVSWYLDRFVSTRIAKFSYGVMTCHLFNNKDPDHLKRESTKVKQANGKFYIPGIFDTILKKDSEITKETQFRQPHNIILTREQFAGWTSVNTTLKCYRGRDADPPKWVDHFFSNKHKSNHIVVFKGSFHDACTIQVEMSHIKPSMKLHRKGTQFYYKLDLEVVVLFGFTELKAYATWKENGVDQRTEASIFYD